MLAILIIISNVFGGVIDVKKVHKILLYSLIAASSLVAIQVLFPINFAQAVLYPFYCRGGYSSQPPVTMSSNGWAYYTFTWAYKGQPGQRWESPPWGISGSLPPRTCVWGDRGGWEGEPNTLCFSMSTPGAVQFIESLRDSNKITPLKIRPRTQTNANCFVVDQFGSFELTPERQ